MAFWTKAAINIVKKQRAAGKLTWEQQLDAIEAIQAAVRVDQPDPNRLRVRRRRAKNQQARVSRRHNRSHR